MNYGYTRAYAPVLRNPRLFHQNTPRSTPIYYPIQQINLRPATNLYPTYPSHYVFQTQPTVQSQSFSPHQYPYHPAPPRSLFPSPVSFSSYSVPSFSYAPTVSSKGLALILIATLILVALDLMIVRPQKR